MDDPGFAATVVHHLEPVLAPRGFPWQRQADESSAVLFHCDGPNVEVALDRYPSWREPLAASYGTLSIPCLDLWVKQEGQGRSWQLEIFDDDVVAAAGRDATQRLEDLQDGSVDEWASQLAKVLDAYFSKLESDEEQPSS